MIRMVAVAAAVAAAVGCGGATESKPPGPEPRPEAPAAATVAWTDLEAARASGKLIFVFFTSGGDEPCEAFEKQVLAREDVARAMRPFACVKRETFPPGGRDALFERIGFGGIPAIAICDSTLEVVESREYGPTKDELVRLLEAVQQERVKK